MRNKKPLEKPELHPDIEPWVALIRDAIDRDESLDDKHKLIEALASQTRRADGEMVHRLIYGSQIRALMRLMTESKSVAALMDLFEEHQQEAGKYAYPDFFKWIEFLCWLNLVQHDGRHFLTPMGQSITNFLIQNGATKVW